jgi:hypothetical protein
MLIELACGRPLRLESFHCQETYCGQLEGRPNPQLNKMLIKQARSQMIPIWGAPHAVHTIRPQIDQSNPERPALPAYQITCDLYSHIPLDPSYTASKLVVVYFCDDIASQPITKIIEDAVRDLKWERLAADFNW